MLNPIKIAQKEHAKEIHSLACSFKVRTFWKFNSLPAIGGDWPGIQPNPDDFFSDESFSNNKSYQIAYRFDSSSHSGGINCHLTNKKSML